MPARMAWAATWTGKGEWGPLSGARPLGLRRVCGQIALRSGPEGSGQPFWPSAKGPMPPERNYAGAGRLLLHAAWNVLHTRRLRITVRCRSG
jgi:hypothetical protein